MIFVNKKPIGIIEAKSAEEGVHFSVHEKKSEGYAMSKLKYLDNPLLPFVYESTGELTRFTDYQDLKPRARTVFSFHRPETFAEWLEQEKPLRTRLHDIPALSEKGFRDCQIIAIKDLEQSFRDARPKALIQMATGAGKTFTAITFIYRLLKYAKAKRILFLVGTKNLGEQAEQEFMSCVPNNDNRKFTELYDVVRLKSSFIPPDNKVYILRLGWTSITVIDTIKKLYTIFKIIGLQKL